MIRIADYIIQSLAAEGLSHIFMVTGRGALFLTDAVAANKKIQGIPVHHEQSASFAAVAYAQYSGKLGVCLVSTGCAMTNALTGVLNSWQDGIPCVFISGQNKLNETSRFTNIPIRTYGQQEADIIPIVESITKYAIMLADPNRVVYEIEKALYLATEGRKGPVWIDVPLDVQNMRIEPDKQEHFVEPDKADNSVLEDLQYVVDSLNNSSRPVVLIGSGVRSGNAISELIQFIEKYQIPMVYSGSAPDVYGSTHKLSIGSVGIMGCSRAGNFTIQNSDLVLVLGNRLTSMTTGTEFEKFAREAKIVVVDIDQVEHSKAGVKIDRLIQTDVKRFIKEINNKYIKKTESDWIEKVQQWKKIFPKCEDKHRLSEKVDLYLLAEILSELMLEDALFHSDSGLNELILPTNIDFKDGQRCIHPASQGSMGFALPALIGSHYASYCPLVAVIGDGSIMMNLQELATIRYQNIPAKIFVINNNAYAVIRKRQIELFRNRTIGTDSSDGVGIPNFEKIAYGFDLPYMKIESSGELREKIQTVLEMDGPILCEIMGLEDQDYISMGHTRTQEKRYVQRPLEDQKPFIDRELFIAEMIIKPIDQ